ncbi:MAG: hypothetical protein EOO87_01175 [Pedobacter sp.]|nr:MAG: hypothetical protein EOO87_01175 [Pedobacter sp.]
MQQLILNSKHVLVFEPSGSKIRIVVLEEGIESVCRKETLKNLKRFLTSKETKIFKGRLQLHKVNDAVEIIVKDKPIAIISTASLEKILNNLQ